jgi:hypothetical protein
MKAAGETVIVQCQSGSDFRKGTLQRGIIFPQLGGFRITGARQKATTTMPSIACGWPVVQRELLFQSLN